MKRSREPDEVNGVEAITAVSEAIHEPRSKVSELDPSETRPDPSSSMTCHLHGKKVTFSSYEEYEAHYNKEHVNRCLECRKNFPSEHFLNLHIEECHDSFVKVRREKGEHTASLTLSAIYTSHR